MENLDWPESLVEIPPIRYEKTSPLYADKPSIRLNGRFWRVDAAYWEENQPAFIVVYENTSVKIKFDPEMGKYRLTKLEEDS